MGISSRRGLSPVVSSIILTGIVLAVGLSVWVYSFNMADVIGDQYVGEVLLHLDTVRERFTVAHVAYDSGLLRVWVYNYGDISIEVDVYVRGDAEGSNASGTPVGVGEVKAVSLSLSAEPGYELSVEVVSRRQNFIYESYIVPF
jgi:flagellin-like protein